jgi:hypothetical protein
MKWSGSQVARLRELCYLGASNKEIAADIGCSLKDVYAKRSQLGITIAKCAPVKDCNKKKPVEKNAEQEHLAELKTALNRVLDEWAIRYGYASDSKAVADVEDIILRPEVTI